MKVKRVLIGLLTAFLVVAGLSAVSYGARAGPPTGFFGFAADFGKTSGFDANTKADLALKSEAVKVGSEIDFAADFGKNEPGKVMVANVITKWYGSVVSYDSAANVIFHVKSDIYDESRSAVDGAYHLNTLRDVAPLSLMITPDKTELVQNYPNPFNPETTIRYALAKPANVTLAVYNILGQQIRTLINTQQRAGKYIVTWDGCDDNGRSVASGIYFYRISAGDFQSVKRVLMLK